MQQHDCDQEEQNLCLRMLEITMVTKKKRFKLKQSSDRLVKPRFGSRVRKPLWTLFTLIWDLTFSWLGASVWEGCDITSLLTNLDHRAKVQIHLMNWNTTSCPSWFRAHWKWAYVCFLLCDQAEVRGRADHHPHPIKHTITADPPPPRHLYNLCTMEGQLVGNLCPCVFLLPSNSIDKPQHVLRPTPDPSACWPHIRNLWDVSVKRWISWDMFKPWLTTRFFFVVISLPV